MENNITNKEHSQVRQIENGTVIDHIPSGQIYKVMQLLDLEKATVPIILGMNLDSHRLGKKGLVKIVDTYCDEAILKSLALVAPTASVSIIRDYKVIEKRQIEAPEKVVGSVKCANSTCITNHEAITTLFSVHNDRGQLELKCAYCEKITLGEQIEITK